MKLAAKFVLSFLFGVSLAIPFDLPAPLQSFEIGNVYAQVSTPVSVKTFGAKGDGISDDTAALQTAFTYAKNTGRALFLPAGTYLCASQISLGSTQGIHIIGDSASSQITGGSVIKYTGTATPFMFLGTPGPIAGLLIENVSIQYTNAAFTGTLLKIVATQYQLRNSSLMGNGVSGALYLLDNDASTSGSIEEVVFDKAQYAIAGQKSDGTGFSNGLNIRASTFNSGITVADIRNPGQGWDINGGTVFEAIANGNGSAIKMDAAVTTAQGLNISGCWMADATANGAWTWIT